jgi:hypothetical protein
MVAIVLAAALGAFVIFWPRTAPPPVPQAGGAAPVDVHEAESAATALRALATDPASLLAAGVRQQVGARVSVAVPPGTAVDPDVTSWAPDGVGGGTMSVTLRMPGRGPVAYAVIMIREGSAWKVLATVPLDETIGSGKPT